MYERMATTQEKKKRLKTLLERLFEEPQKRQEKTGGVTLADFMPASLRGEGLSEKVKEEPVSVPLFVERFLPVNLSLIHI